MTTAEDVWADSTRPRTVVDRARLVWNARAEASRLHRLAVDSARHQAAHTAHLDRRDARIYRCPGCGEWRYRWSWRGTAGARVTCPACGTHRNQRSAA